jgi:Na+-driven multidrug efflux pump
MKPILKKILIWLIAIFSFFALLAFIADVFIMPAYVDSEELVVPNLVGKSKEEAS